MADRDEDRRLLAVLAAAGSDLTRPAHIIHYLHFRSGPAAGSAAQALTAEGFENTKVVSAPPKSFAQRLMRRHLYVCIGETRAVPSEANVFATTDRLTALAEQFGGNYDGWEASIEKPSPSPAVPGDAGGAPAGA